MFFIGCFLGALLSEKALQSKVDDFLGLLYRETLGRNFVSSIAGFANFR